MRLYSHLQLIVYCLGGAVFETHTWLWQLDDRNQWTSWCVHSLPGGTYQNGLWRGQKYLYALLWKRYWEIMTCKNTYYLYPSQESILLIPQPTPRLALAAVTEKGRTMGFSKKKKTGPWKMRIGEKNRKHDCVSKVNRQKLTQIWNRKVWACFLFRQDKVRRYFLSKWDRLLDLRAWEVQAYCWETDQQKTLPAVYWKQEHLFKFFFF